MGLLSKVKGLFANRSPTEEKTVVKLVNERGSGFYAWDGKLFKSDIIRSCIRPKAKAVGKLDPKHIRDNGEEMKVNPEPYIKFLLEEPNPLMTGQMLQEKLVNQLQLNNNAFAIIIRGDRGYPRQLYPVPAASVQAEFDNQGRLFLEFRLPNAKKMEVPYTDVIHLRQDYNSDDLFGDSPKEALRDLMEVINTTDQGIINAIKNGGVIKWLLKFNQTIRPEDKEKELKKFVDNYLSIENEIGAAATDPKFDAEQVEPHDFVPEAEQMTTQKQRVYDFFNTNEKIVQSKYDEDEWISYYESEIEPLAKQLSEEFTRKLFTRKERGHGNKIVFEASSLHYASMSTKTELWKMVDRGAMTPNEWRRIMNLAPLEGGDEPLRRKDTDTVGGDGENENRD